jgi:hypothetical protein
MHIVIRIKGRYSLLCRRREELLLVELGSCYVAPAGLELIILLLKLPECWDYSLAPPLTLAPI